jgi:hypothetical protein
MSLVLQHRIEGLGRRQGIPASLAKAATAATGRAIVATCNVAHPFGRFQFGYRVEESRAKLVVESDLQRPVLIQELAPPHRLSESLLHQKAICRKLQDLALVGTRRRDGPGAARRDPRRPAAGG